MRVHNRWRDLAIATALIGAGLIAAAQLPATTVRQEAKNAAQESAQTAQKAAPTYVGTDTCKTCHADLYKEWETTPHYKTLLDTHAGAAKQGCEGCHGPGSEHVASGGQTPPPYDFLKMTAKQTANRCLTCHQSHHEQLNFSTSVHLRNDVTCTDCHSPHHSTDKQFLLVKQEPQLCFSCHREIQPLFRMPFHHKVNEGMVKCSDCHNPHGTFGQKQLRTASARDIVCFKCHVDKQGPFVFEHMPVKTDGCMDCHVPHGSPNPHLLRYANVNQLCLQCHTVSSFSHAPGTPSFHNQAAKYQACTMCHTQIHGSNVSDIFFQ
jgi:DmsE family decaheme c-type cytochrome